MLNRNEGIEKFSVVPILLLISLLLIPSLLLGEKAERESEEKTGFELTVNDELISLSAKDASLSEVMEEIGRKMEIKIIGNIPEGEKISVEFEKLSLKEALEKLSASYGYVMDSEKGEEKITKIVVLPKGKETAPLRVAARESETQERKAKDAKRPEPFKFEFNPAEFIQK
ncbi:MAG: hypothetical protein D8M57_04860 [Candidatus Scalindua sp. AMX11]|nr:MAG: hypothetical protein DWQ00_03735 [Candidatus Scalindua sp.]NOG84556.1 hypothetical protein [Planctomycetota bacterium]RZV92331.1 MAG: hypothetical protein EX341_04595 [Candidatus Scalindua sp. SCAELEC01]TDE66145.1 MAG: hypothetical protein D8M57_04860 [Candidatus Scalindua sp. AMX11]GJQ59119.1 MAG: hypothetical protein SCALA701_19200 [Candidatus Scalindua sp.]